MNQSIKASTHWLSAIGYRLTFGIVFCMLGLMSVNYAYGQSLVNNSKFKNLKIEVDKKVDIKVGGNDCGSTITRLRSVGAAVIVTAEAPSNKGCSFVNLSLSIGSKIAPLKALDGGYKFQGAEAGYRWGDGVANADMWFEPFDADLLSTGNVDIKLSDSACTSSQCVAQGILEKGAFADNGGGTFNGPGGIIWRRCALGRSWDSHNKTCKGEPVKAAWLNMVELASKDTFGGFNDWRLPTETEFSNLVGKQQKCSDLRQRLSELFPGVWSGVYFGSHHWLLDNSTAMTDPSSANLEPSSRSCTMTNKDLRPHAPQPAVFVRGGAVPEAWLIALSKTPQSQTLSEQSKKAGVAMIEGYNSKLERVAEMFSTPATATTSSSNSTVEWTITNEENGGGLAHWYTKKYNAKCTSGRKSGQLITIHLLKSSGKYQEVSGSVKNSLAEAARDACS